MIRVLSGVILCAIWTLPVFAEDNPRRYLLASPAARPAVRVLVDTQAQTGRFRNGSGVLVGRCDVMITANHVVNGASADQLHIYSPQIRGRAVSALPDPVAASLRNASGNDPLNLDADVAVVRLAECPTHHYVPLKELRPLTFGDLGTLRSAGFACDSSDVRAPEIVDFAAELAPTPLPGGVSRQLRLTPGARPGQSGAPVFSFNKRTGARALHMILVATARKKTAPVGCGIDRSTGRSQAGQSAYGALFTQQFIDDFKDYVAGLP